jgi:fermentation-respiration switch protein FrsA (DUF1100 family)
MLFITGDNAHSREFSEDAYKRAAEPKELHIVPGLRRLCSVLHCRVPAKVPTEFARPLSAAGSTGQCNTARWGSGQKLTRHKRGASQPKTLRLLASKAFQVLQEIL